MMVLSPGSIATGVLRRSGVTPPLAKFPVPDDAALDRWQRARHGGWVTADHRGVIVPVSDADMRSAYPAAWSVTGCWDVLRAAELREANVLHELDALCRRVAGGDLAPLFIGKTYTDFSLSVAEALGCGEPFAVELPGDDHRDPRLVVAPLWSSTPIPFPSSDIVLAALLSQRVPRLVSATRLEALGVEAQAPFPLYDGVVVRPGEDPIVAGVRLREAARDAGNERLRVQLRVVNNALSWGVYARLDQQPVRGGGRGRRGRLIERATEWSWPPIAATVPAVVRLWLGLLDYLVSEAGSTIIARDTDGAAIFASPDGGEKLKLPDGRVVRALAHAEIDSILARFDALDPFGDGRPFWSVVR
jgi:hypothetical protein